MLGEVIDIEADTEGNFYVLDGSNGIVQVCNREGQFIQSFGRMGEGPGEWEKPAILAMDYTRGRTAVVDEWGAGVLFFDYEALEDAPIVATPDFSPGDLCISGDSLTYATLTLRHLRAKVCSMRSVWRAASTTASGLKRNTEPTMLFCAVICPSVTLIVTDSAWCSPTTCCRWFRGMTQ